MSAGGRGVDTTYTAAAAAGGPCAGSSAGYRGGGHWRGGLRHRRRAGAQRGGGNPLMTRVVGTGCALSAVVAASAALPGDRLENVAAACGLMKQAGAIAARQEAGQLYSGVSRRAVSGGAGMKRINALTIAGTDPSGGAGIVPI